MTWGQANNSENPYHTYRWLIVKEESWEIKFWSTDSQNKMITEELKRSIIFEIVSKMWSKLEIKVILVSLLKFAIKIYKY